MLDQFNPQNVFRYFEELSKIPHGSYNEKAISDYCMEFAKERNLECWQDDAWNVIIHKPATAGRENEPGIIIQGHLDMVCEKDTDSTHDFKSQGLKLETDGDYIWAKGTTLGGDDGIAIAYALAILDSDDISHPDLECVFTTAEEVGMDGAQQIQAEHIHNRQLLNIDSEVEGILTVGCAGPAMVNVEFTADVTKVYEGGLFTLKLFGTKGGHSGMEIDKGRVNVNKVMGRVLRDLKQAGLNPVLVDINGGSVDNAIPKDGSLRFILPMKEAMTTKGFDVINKTVQDIKTEYAGSDDNLQHTMEMDILSKPIDAYSQKNTDKITLLLTALPDGVQKFSFAVPGLVETSLNLGVINTENKTKLNKKSVSSHFCIRSSVGAAKEDLISRIKLIADFVGAKVEIKSNNPAWEYKQVSLLRDKMSRIYKEKYGKEPKIEIIHAGLECGLLSERLPGLDAVSFGPNLLDIHTPNEKMDIASVQRTWEYLLEILK